MADAFDKYLVLTFVGETRVLAITDDDELDEAQLPGFDGDAQVPPPLCGARIKTLADACPTPESGAAGCVRRNLAQGCTTT